VDNTIAYTLYINNIQKKTGSVSSNGYAKYEPELADGRYNWSIVLEDDAGNTNTKEVFDLYVDTKDPYITLVSPKDFFVCTDEYPLAFNFTCQDTFCEDYGMKLYYELHIDGALFDENCSGYMTPGEYVNIEDVFLLDGAHNWSVYVEDKAGNTCTGKVRNFYVNCDELEVELISPDGGFVPANPQFNFSVMGGAGLPFDYELLINGTEVKNGTFVVGEDPENYYSVTATVKDAENIPWTVRVTDCAGRECTPTPASLYFSVDTKAPAAVKNLNVFDAMGDTTWYYVYDEPGLHVSWDKNTEADLYDGEDGYYGTPYVVFISDFKPSCIEDMEVAVPVSKIYDSDDDNSYNSSDSDYEIPAFLFTKENGGESVCCNETIEPVGKMYMHIGEYGEKPLVYGKDYWVAVIALDRAGNYDDCFTMCGPVKTYEDMTITLDAGWNLKSIPKNPAKFNNDPCSVFGECSTVIYWNGSCWEFPKTIEPCKGYWVYSPEACVSNVKFKPMSVDSTSPDVPASLDLAPGWQMIGHTNLLPVHWSQTLGSMQGLLGVEYKFSNIITYSHHEGWGGTISLGLIDFLKASEEETDEIPYPVEVLKSEGVMVPGQGYWIFVKECGTYASVEDVNFYENINQPV
jgi:hypothetical protein